MYNIYIEIKIHVEILDVNMCVRLLSDPTTIWLKKMCYSVGNKNNIRNLTSVQNTYFVMLKYI